MGLLAVSGLAVLVGVLVIAFLALRFALKLAWRMAMLAVVAVMILVVLGGAAYWWTSNGAAALPAIPGWGAFR